MSLDPTVDIFKSVRAALIADPTIVSTVSERVASDWAIQMAEPFIRLSAPVTKPFEMDGAGDGAETKLRVHCFANASGPATVGRLAARVRAVLQNADLSIDGSETTACQYVQTMTTADPDEPGLRMAVVEFTITTSSN